MIPGKPGLDDMEARDAAVRAMRVARHEAKQDAFAERYGMSETVMYTRKLRPLPPVNFIRYGRAR